MLKRGSVAVAAAALLAGCGAPPVSETTPFVAAEHERCAGNGHGRVVGRATVRAGDGQDRPAAWDEVVLWPSSPYSRTLATELAAGDRPAPEARLAPYARIVRADSAGRFTFEDLPPCRYVALLAVPGSLAGLRAGTGYAAAEAEVAEGRTVTLALAWPPTEPFRAAPATAPAVAEPPRSAPAKAPCRRRAAPERTRQDPRRRCRTATAAARAEAPRPGRGRRGRPVRALRPRPGAAAALRVGDRAGARQVRAAARPRGEPARTDGLHPGPGRPRALRRLHRKPLVASRDAPSRTRAAPAPASVPAWRG